ncbi:hypothetical protein BDF19DRAFT_412112 [Syncephalis fuscata]|nr:hypothetical protein BDF19DRAFT_412112 [Syncephalis fuscata]
MNYTSNLAKHFTNTPHQRRTRLSLAARTFQQQDQQEQDLAENTLAPRPSYGRPNKRARQTNFTGDKALARQSDYNKLSSDPLSIFAPQLEQLSRSVIALESNFQHLGGINEALTTFNDAFDTFLRAMSINAQCVIFPEAPNPLSFKRQPQEQPEDANMLGASIYPSTAQTVLSSSAEPDISTGTFLDNTFASTEESVKSKIPVRKKRAAKAAPPPKPFPMKKLIEGLPLRYRDSSLL